MSKLVEYLQANPLVWILGLLEAGLLTHFLLQYILRGLPLRFRLVDLVKQIESVEPQNPETIKSKLDRIFSGTRLAKGWQEFEATLHEQHSLVGAERRVSAIRATQPAAAFFNLETVADPWIGSEYFKHLPGILTGFGIIGTFFGLIQGLVHFDPGLNDSAELRKGLGALFGHVRDAFIFSGVSIAAAIAVTISEKWLYTSCAKWIFALSAALDGLFRTGVGEEYLSSLVKASEDTTTQVRQLKEAMVEDLWSLLTNLSERQIQAIQQLSSDLGRNIRESLQVPLADIVQTVREASQQRNEAFGSVLERLMTSFLAQMRETVGSQLNDLGGLIQQTAQAVTTAELGMQGLVSDIQKAGNDSTSGMQTAFHDLMRQLAEHQRANGEAVSAATDGMLRQLNEAVVSMTGAVAIVSDSHAATMEGTREILGRFAEISAQIAGTLSSGTASVISAAASLQGAAERMSRAGSELASRDIAGASTQLAIAAQTIANAVGQLGSTAVRFEGVASKVLAEHLAAHRKQLRDEVRLPRSALNELAE